MSVNDRRFRTAALILVATIPAALGAYCLAETARYPALAAVLIHGPLVLVAFWSALSPAPFYLRWSCGGLALWAAVRFAPKLWRMLFVWQTVSDALLSFTILCLLRELGLGIQPATDDSHHSADELRWQFTLRRLLGWVAGAAVLTLAWKQTLAAVLPLAATSPWPWNPAAHRLIVTFALTTIDLLALGALLRPGRVRWRIVVLSVVAALYEAVIRLYLGEALFGVRWIPGGVFGFCLYDLFYLGPMLLALFLVRSGGYRWTASHSFSP